MYECWLAYLHIWADLFIYFYSFIFISYIGSAIISLLMHYSWCQFALLYDSRTALDAYLADAIRDRVASSL